MTRSSNLRIMGRSWVARPVAERARAALEVLHGPVPWAWCRSYWHSPPPHCAASTHANDLRRVCVGAEQRARGDPLFLVSNGAIAERHSGLSRGLPRLRKIQAGAALPGLMFAYNSGSSL